MTRAALVGFEAAFMPPRGFTTVNWPEVPPQ